MFINKTEETDGHITIRNYYNNTFQGELTVDTQTYECSVGIKSWVKKTEDGGMLTNRDAVPETEFSYYEIIKKLCNAFNNSYSIDKIGVVTPEQFGYKSYRVTVKEEEYSDKTRDELIEELLDYKDMVESMGY